jgi:hypothetical protein
MSTDEYYKCGRVVEVVGEGYFLVEWDPGDQLHGYTKSLMTLHNVMCVSSHEEWNFFNTRESLDEYIDWVETPPINGESKVLPFVKN